MGCFDSIVVNIECPYCEKLQKLVGQTKYLSSTMRELKIGDKVPVTGFKFVTGEVPFIFTCENAECMKYCGDNCSHCGQKYKRLVSRTFTGFIEVKDSRFSKVLRAEKWSE